MKLDQAEGDSRSQVSNLQLATGILITLAGENWSALAFVETARTITPSTRRQRRPCVDRVGYHSDRLRNQRCVAWRTDGGQQLRTNSSQPRGVWSSWQGNLKAYKIE
jgi:hypothetical protein